MLCKYKEIKNNCQYFQPGSVQSKLDVLESFRARWAGNP
jgi:hypothetical protein